MSVIPSSDGVDRFLRTARNGNTDLGRPEMATGIVTNQSHQALPSESPQDFSNGNWPDPPMRLGKGNEASTRQDRGHKLWGPALRKQGEDGSKLAGEGIAAPSNTCFLQVSDPQPSGARSRFCRKSAQATRHQVRRKLGSQRQLGHSRHLGVRPVGVEGSESSGCRGGWETHSPLDNRAAQALRSNPSRARLIAKARRFSGEGGPGLGPARVAGQDSHNERRSPSCHRCKRSKV